MSFEEFPREACTSFNDIGLVYTRNKYGRVRSPAGYSLTLTETTSDTKSQLKGPCCFFTTDYTVFKPRSLYLICLDFIAKNISMVESLLGFPAIVSEDLFREVYREEGFRTSSKDLKLFCDAYDGLVLSKLSLDSEHLLINSHLEYIFLFGFLTELDVSHCRMGDDHELVPHIAHLTCLARLSLKENCISDVGVRRLTLPQRLLKGSLAVLSVLDLSLNPGITDGSVKYLSKLATLTALNLSGTRITFGRGVSHLVNNTNLSLAFEIDDFKIGQSFTVTEGWAVDVVNDWKEMSKKSKQIKQNNNKMRVSAGKRSNFYQSTRADTVQEKRAVKNPSEMLKILLHSKKTKLCNSEFNGMIDCSMKSALEKSEPNKPPKKKFKSSISVPMASTSQSDGFVDKDLVREYMSSVDLCMVVSKRELPQDTYGSW